ncbi:MAG: hypothetical protein V3V51_01520 [Desulfobacterales bacterium]
MKKIALVYLAIILVPLNISADIIFFKDGMKTVCHDRAWEEDGEIKCEYNGSILTYQKNDVLRIEKIKIDKEFEKPSKKSRALLKTTSTPAKQSPEAKQPAPEKELQNLTNNAGSIKTKGLIFYNPRRPQKYWTLKTAKHNTFKEAVAALAKQYDRSPDWIQHHMGNTNDLDEIHRNLTNSKLNAPAKIQEVDYEKAPEILFYNPRRPQKYWTSATAKHNTFKEAISTLAKEYDRSQEWVQQHMGNTNNLNEIHQNLANHKSAGPSQ